MSLNVPPVQNPITDPETGLITRQWADYFTKVAGVVAGKGLRPAATTSPQTLPVTVDQATLAALYADPEPDTAATLRAIASAFTQATLLALALEG